MSPGQFGIVPPTYLDSVPIGCLVFRWRFKSAWRDSVTPQSGHWVSQFEGDFLVDWNDIATKLKEGSSVLVRELRGCS